VPELQWDETDFIECLEVVPEVEEYKTSYVFAVLRNDLRMLLTVRPHESAIQVTLCQEGSGRSLMDFALFVRGKTRYIHEYLELADCVVGPNTSWYLEVGDPFDPARFPAGLTVEIGIKPFISVRFTGYSGD
jgi:hypothetical protein